MNRRKALKMFTGGAGLAAMAAPGPLAGAQSAARRGMPPLKITDVKVIMTQPAGSNLVVVKVLTSEPGLYGVGCATHAERPFAVAAYLEKHLKPFVIEGVTSGGALMTTTEVENFPGFPDGILGPELMDSMRKQAERFGAEFVTDDVSAVDLTGDVKVVTVGDTVYRSRAVVIATGSAWRPLGVPGEQELLGHGVSSCATCDGFFFRGQHIAVVGGGDSAMEEATFLTRFAESVTIVHRRDEFRASKIMAERALSNPKIRVMWDSVVTEVVDGGGKVGGVRLRNVKTGHLVAA